MRTRSILPLVAVAALAVAPGCQQRRASQPPATSIAQAPMPQYMPPPPAPTIADSATKADVYRVDDKVTGLSGQVAELNTKIDRLAVAPPVMPPPTPPMAM